MSKIVLIAHNLRSALNVGSLLRTAEGLGVEIVYLTGYTPYPVALNDERLPHIAHKTDRQIAKTALGAEKLVNWQHRNEILAVIEKLKRQKFTVVALEQAPDSIKLFDFKPPSKVAIIVGREVEGVEPEILAACDHILEIPMLGKKESFNVVQATAMALYQFRFVR